MEVPAKGEATHGSREFFRLKHRMLEFLATEMGFTIFSIEANMPEAYRLNEYVLTGKGDPAALLKGLYFWTWDTEEVLEMIQWMRAFNASGNGRVEFTGFDMQTPGVALRNVMAFVAQRDPGYVSALQSSAAMVGSSAQGQQNFGAITDSLPAKELTGKNARLSGAIRTENVVGEAHLWFRADANRQVKSFRNLGANGISGTTAWKAQTLELELPADTDQIFFGGTFAGSGKVWFDDLTLEVDGKPVPLASAGFEDAGGSLGSARTGYYAGGAGTEVFLDTGVFAGGKQSLRLERLPQAPQPDVRTAVTNWTNVVKHLENGRATYREAGAVAPDIEWAIQNARVMLQCLQMRAGAVSRDESMARNVEWILSQSPQAKIVLWAHNRHVASGNFHGFTTMGGTLRNTYGERMVVFGFGFHQGSFQAIKPGGALQNFTVERALTATWDALMASSGLPIFALDLRQAPDELRQPTKSRSIGAVFSPDAADRYLVEASFPANFDALLFVESTTAAIRNKAPTVLTKAGDGEWRDAHTRVQFKLPDNWRIANQQRWGDNETTIILTDGSPELISGSGLYYRLDQNPTKRTAEEVERSLLAGMAAKQVQRQGAGYTGYRNQAGSERRHQIDGRPALTWVATYTANGKPMAEVCTYIQSDTVTALFFTRLSETELKAFQQRFAPIVESLRIP